MSNNEIRRFAHLIKVTNSSNLKLIINKKIYIEGVIKLYLLQVVAHFRNTQFSTAKIVYGKDRLLPINNYGVYTQKM